MKIRKTLLSSVLSGMTALILMLCSMEYPVKAEAGISGKNQPKSAPAAEENDIDQYIELHLHLDGAITQERQLLANAVDAAFTSAEVKASIRSQPVIDHPSAGMPSGENRRIIIDTDTAGDDALAILMAAKSPDITIEGVTVLQGNVSLEQAADNALMTLETAGCDAEVCLGAATALDGVKRKTFSVYGTDGMGDKGLIHPSGKPSDKDAVDFILETVEKYPDEIEIASIGPATNIANAILKDPETMSHVKRIWSMGTAGLGPGNATPVAEFNVYKDAMAYNVMLDSGIDITIVGLDICDKDGAVFDSNQLSDMENGNHVQRYAALSFSKLLEFRRETRGIDNVNACDAVFMAALIWPGFVVDTLDCQASCIAHDDCEAFGEVIFYRPDIAYDSGRIVENTNVTLVTEVDLDHFFENVNILIAK
jgi:purine nucleosidase